MAASCHSNGIQTEEACRVADAEGGPVRTVVIPIAQRRRLGIEDGGEVALDESPEGLLLRRPDQSVDLRRDEHGTLTVAGGRWVTTEETLRAIDEDRASRGRA